MAVYTEAWIERQFSGVCGLKGCEDTNDSNEAEDVTIVPRKNKSAR